MSLPDSGPARLSVLRVFAITLLVMTVYEAAKQFVFGNALTLWQSHITTIIFTSSLASLISWVYWGKLKIILDQKQEVEVREARARTHLAMLTASHHYLNNALNMLQLIQFELNKTGTVDQETMTLIREEINKSSQELRELGEMSDPTHENISKFIKDRL